MEPSGIPAASPLLAVTTASLMTGALSAGADDVLPQVPPVDLSTLEPADFRDTELEVPFYLAHLHRVANSIESTGPNRGFITLPVWRPKEFNEPYNARVLENHLALAFFYCSRRPWNPYYGHSALRGRLEALLEFWRRSQNSDGWFSEYGPRKWNLPASGFSTMFMAGTIELLRDGPPIDPELFTAVRAAQRKAILALLKDRRLFASARNFSNQYSGIWGAALSYLRLYPDDEIDALVHEKLPASLREHQSPAGYWYENRGCDWIYTLRTHHGNLWMAWSYASGSDLEDPFVVGERRWSEWMCYNTAPEPNGELLLNRAIQTRTKGKREFRHNPIAEKSLTSRPFMPTVEERRALLAERREQLERDWPRIPELDVGCHHAYSPHVLLNLRHRRWHPTNAQREEAIRCLPCLARERFTHQRVDNSSPQAFTFIRRTSYYAVFNSGCSLSDLQRFGLGILWLPGYGTALMSHSGSNSAAWGTVADGSENVCETELRNASFAVDGASLTPEPGVRDLARGELGVTYPLSGDGGKKVTFGERAIGVKAELKGTFTEQLPLLLAPGAMLDISPGVVELCGRAGRVRIEYHPKGARAEERATDVVVADKAVRVVLLRSADELTYRISFPDSQE